jgi:inorganic pyrophosphatase
VSEAFPEFVELVVEVPRFGFVKRRDDGRIDFVSPWPCPFNYGSVPNTVGGDGDREDALLLGPRVSRGTRVRAPVVARVAFVDAGLQDAKWICSHASLSEAELRSVAAFFVVYARAKRLLYLLRGGVRGETRYAGITRAPRARAR